MKAKRQAAKEEKQRQKRISTIIGVGIAVLVLGVIGYFVLSPFISGGGFVGPVGEEFPTSGSNDHIPDENTDPNPYSTNPPTSGHHYGRWLDAGFYDINNEKYPEGHLVHNLEHGYIIFWYNCKVISEAECTSLKAQIKEVMAGVNNFKVIGYPWEKIDEPLVLTSWGFRLSMPTFDAKIARAFIDQHRNRAPEPNAP